MEVINKKELAEKTASRMGGYNVKEVAGIIDATFDQIADELRSGNRVNIRQFASFSTTTRKARTFRNPKTGDPVEKPETRLVKIKSGIDL